MSTLICKLIKKQVGNLLLYLYSALLIWFFLQDGSSASCHPRLPENAWLLAAIVSPSHSWESIITGLMYFPTFRIARNCCRLYHSNYRNVTSSVLVYSMKVFAEAFSGPDTNVGTVPVHPVDVNAMTVTERYKGTFVAVTK